MRILPVLLLAFLVVSLPTPSHAFLDFFKKDLEKIPETEELRAQEAAANPKVTEAMQLEAAGKIDKAYDIYRGVVKKYPLTTSAAMSQYKVGAIQKSRGDFTDAFESFQQFVDDYKRSSAFDAAVASQFEIAKACQSGEHKEKFVGIARKVQRSEVLEMYQSVIKNAPYSEFAPQAQFSIGEVLEQQEKTQEAVAAYKKVVAQYPKSPLAADAQFRIGEIGAQAIEDGSRNIANVDSSRRAYEDLLLGYEDDARADQARSRVVQFDELEARKAFDIGRFYEKQKKYRSAAFYYDRVAQSEGTSAAAEARERLAIVEAKLGSQISSAQAERDSATESQPETGSGEKVKSGIPRPRLVGRLFGRKDRVEEGVEETAPEDARVAVGGSEPPVAAEQPTRPAAVAASAPEVASVAPKAKERKGYLGPPAPDLALGKKENKMRLDTDQLQNLPFAIGKIDMKDPAKGLKTLSEDLPDDLSDLVIPPAVDEDEPEATIEPELEESPAVEKKVEPATSAETEEEEDAAGGLKIPPPPDESAE